MSAPPEELGEVVVLLARQRSGTNALQSALATHPEIHCTREVFHPSPETQAHLDDEANFFRFLAEHGAAEPTDVTLGSQRRLFLDYVEFLRARTTKRFLVVDVKLNATHHFDGPWRPLVGWPAMFGFVLRYRLRVLHLVRANHLRQHVSMIKARQTKRWVVEGEGPAGEDVTVAVPTARLLPALARQVAEDEAVRRAFDRPGHYLGLEYAELFTDLPAGLGAVADWLGVERAFDPSGATVAKQAVLPLSETIENFDEVAGILRGTRFEALLEDERL